MNEITNNINEYTVVPSINSVPLKYKQIFPTVSTETIDNGVIITPNGVAKNTIHFDREEDMILMCLSAFVHDYVHDYNLESMHVRVKQYNLSIAIGRKYACQG